MMAEMSCSAPSSWTVALGPDTVWTKPTCKAPKLGLTRSTTRFSTRSRDASVVSGFSTELDGAAVEPSLNLAITHRLLRGNLRTCHGECRRLEGDSRTINHNGARPAFDGELGLSLHIKGSARQTHHGAALDGVVAFDRFHERRSYSQLPCSFDCFHLSAFGVNHQGRFGL